MNFGDHAHPRDLSVNACREKKLTNIRAAGRDENVILTTPREMGLEKALGGISQDELVAVTPKSRRLRQKQHPPNPPSPPHRPPNHHHTQITHTLPPLPPT